MGVAQCSSSAIAKWQVAVCWQPGIETSHSDFEWTLKIVQWKWKLERKKKNFRHFPTLDSQWLVYCVLYIIWIRFVTCILLDNKLLYNLIYRPAQNIVHSRNVLLRCCRDELMRWRFDALMRWCTDETVDSVIPALFICPYRRTHESRIRSDAGMPGRPVNGIVKVQPEKKRHNCSFPSSLYSHCKVHYLSVPKFCRFLHRY